MNAPQNGEEAERRELSRLLPAPGTPGLTPARYARLEDTLMNEISQAHDAPAPVRRPARRWALAAIPVAAVAAAAALVVNVTGSGSGHHADSIAVSPRIAVEPASAQGVSALLNQAADAAAHQKVPVARADQYVYIRSEVGYSHQIHQKTMDGPVALDHVHQREVWLSQDPSVTGLIRENGEDVTLHNSGGQTGDAATTAGGTGVLNEAQAAALPKDPGALLARIYALTEGQGPSKNGAAFNWIGDTVSEAIIPSGVNAAIWRAAARIPGVVLVDDATDAAGRHGEAVAFVSDGERTEFIFDRTTHLYLGERSYLVKDTSEGRAGTLLGTSAVLARGVVDKTGDLPQGPRA
jgi:hypothetical protein